MPLGLPENACASPCYPQVRVHEASAALDKHLFCCQGEVYNNKPSSNTTGIICLRAFSTRLSSGIDLYAGGKQNCSSAVHSSASNLQVLCAWIHESRSILFHGLRCLL